MLRFDLAEIIRTPGMHQVYVLDEAPYTDDDVQYVAPITGRITVTNTGSMLLVRGPIRTRIAMECSRCLNPVSVPIAADIEEEFDLRLMEDAVHHDRVIEVVEEEIGRVFDGKVLQMDVLLRQAALLAAPLQPLCREDCPGIPAQTPETGADSEPFHHLPFLDLSQRLKNDTQ